MLYEKPKSNLNAISDDGDNSDSSDDKDQDDGFQIVCNEPEPELADEFDPLIRKVRTVVKIFRKSPTKNDDVLQKYIREKFGKEMQLLIDVKTRWNSLYFMLDRFHNVKNSISKSLIDLKSSILFKDEEWALINILVTTLEPLRLGVEALCDITIC